MYKTIQKEALPMKKLLALTTATMLMLSAMGVTAFADDGVKLIVNGETVDFTGDQEPVIQNGRTLVPFRAAFEKMGAEVNWYDDIRLCEAVYGDTTVGIAIGDTKVSIGDGAEIESDVPAQIINGRTMVPLRILSESIGAEVSWDNATRTVTVTTPEIKGEAPASASCDTKSGTVTGNVSTVNFKYPVVTDVYTAADLLNKNILDDITEVATEVANNNETGQTDISIDYSLRFNDGGVLSILYLIDGEAVSWYNYGIVNGARIEDEEYALITTGGAEEVDDTTADASEKFSMEEYTVSAKGADGHLCLTATAYYPQFIGDEAFVASLNTQLESSAKKAADSFLASYEDEAVEYYDNATEHLYEVPYSYSSNCDVDITEDNVAVINNEFSQLVGGKDVTNGSDIIKVSLTTGEIIE
jgi:hypothetical protein